MHVEIVYYEKKVMGQDGKWKNGNSVWNIVFDVRFGQKPICGRKEKNMKIVNMRRESVWEYKCFKGKYGHGYIKSEMKIRPKQFSSMIAVFSLSII